MSLLRTTEEERYGGRSHNSLDRTGIPDVRQLPVNGKQYTVAEDALNIKMREEEDYVAAIGQPPREGPGRCLGWNRTLQRPCRAWAAKNIEGKYVAFCLRHVHATYPSNRHTPGILMSPQAIVVNASRMARHGAYSDIIRLQMQEALKQAKDDDTRREVERDIEAMQAVDTDDVVQGLKDLIRIQLGLVARLTRRYARGEVSPDEFTAGIVVLSEQIRKLSGTKFDILGSSSDELNDAIGIALREAGLSGDGVSDSEDALEVAFKDMNADEEGRENGHG